MSGYPSALMEKLIYLFKYTEEPQRDTEVETLALEAIMIFGLSLPYCCEPCLTAVSLRLNAFQGGAGGPFSESSIWH